MFDKLITRAGLADIHDKVLSGERLSSDDGLRLYHTLNLPVVGYLANLVRERMHGDMAYFVRNQHINYTNICYFKCKFCAFSKGKMSENLRGRPYNLGADVVVERAREAWDRGAVEVCLQGVFILNIQVKPILIFCVQSNLSYLTCTSMRFPR